MTVACPERHADQLVDEALTELADASTPGGAADLLDVLGVLRGGDTGLAPTEADRRRGLALAAFAGTVLPDAVLRDVVEALEGGDVPEEVAGAALSLDHRAPARIAASLQRAIDNRADLDAPVVLPGRAPTSVLTEIVRALGRLGTPAAAEVLDDLAAQPWPGSDLRREIGRVRPRRIPAQRAA
jgi:hypothetical protein